MNYLNSSSQLQPSSSFYPAALVYKTDTAVVSQQSQEIKSNVPSPSKANKPYKEDSENSIEYADALYFPLPGIDMNSFKNLLSLTPSHERDLSLFHSDPSPPTQASDPEPTQVHGKVVRLNGRELALFCYKDKLYAVNEKCPHMGGPLHLGDIEELPGSTGTDQHSPHIVCPWHKWCFELSTGKQVRPLGRHRDIETFPVRADDNGKIFIGFMSFDPSCFISSDF